MGKKKRQFGFVTPKLQAYNILISKRKIHKTWSKNTKKGWWRITGVNFRIPIHVKATLDAALAHDGGGVTGPATQMSVSTSEPNKKDFVRKKTAYQRDPGEGAPARRPARASDRGRRGARWDLVSTAPTREVRRGAPRWLGAEEAGEQVQLLPPPPCPCACRPGRAPGVCGRCASLDGRVCRLGRGRRRPCREGEGPGVVPEVGPEAAA